MRPSFVNRSYMFLLGISVTSMYFTLPNPVVDVPDVPFLDHSPVSRKLIEVGGTKSNSMGDIAVMRCAELLEERRDPQSMIHTEDPNKEIHARFTKTDPGFYISLHNQEFDKTRWKMMETGVYYERFLTQAFVQVLRNRQGPVRMIDVGGTNSWSFPKMIGFSNEHLTHIMVLSTFSCSHERSQEILVSSLY